MLKTVSTQLALASDTLPEVLAKGNTTGGTDLAVSSGDDITLADNSKVIFGAGSDLSIYSDGTTGQVTGDVNVTGAATIEGVVTAGSGTSTLGSIIIKDRHPDGFLTSLSTLYGSGSAAIGYGAAGTTGAGTFSSTTAQADAARGAYVVGSTHTWYTGAAQTVAIGSPLTMTSRMTLDASGNLNLTTGNVVLANGAGIDFSATPGTGTSELLDDYEEGIWSPAFISTGATFAYAEQFGSYVKVGNLVTLQMRLRTSSVTGTTSNPTNVTGLPFASANLNVNNASAGAVGLCDVSGGLAISIGNNEASLINLWNFGIVAAPSAASISGKYFIATISYRSA